jgi:hypothetical protein
MATRSRATTRRSPRPAPRPVDASPAERPLLVPFAAFFGLLVAAEDVYLAWLMWTPEIGWDWFMAGPLLLAVLAVVGSVLVFAGRPRGWVVLAVAAALPLGGLIRARRLLRRPRRGAGVLVGGPARRGAAGLPAPDRPATRPRMDTGASPTGGTAKADTFQLASLP